MQTGYLLTEAERAWLLQVLTQQIPMATAQALVQMLATKQLISVDNKPEQ